jgi:ribose 5-phosphate isomerase B
MRGVYVGADHGGFRLKDIIVKELREQGWVVTDLSGDYDPEDDYPDVGFKVGEKVAKENVFGILICRSSSGICMVANKVKGIRAASCLSEEQARLAREHNDANIVCLSGDLVNEELNLKIVDVFLKTLFSSEERHIRRVQKIDRYEAT